jgi:hypothetical protein
MAIYVLFIPLIYLLAKHKNTDHSVGIAVSVLLLFVFNPVLKLNWKKADWIVADYGLAILLIVWIIHDVVKYLRAVKKIKLHHELIDFELDQFKK